MPDLVTFLNPRTCGIYKNGQPRFKTNPITGKRTEDIDNELAINVDNYLHSRLSPGEASVALDEVHEHGIIVPTYYDNRYNQPIQTLLSENEIDGITIGDLISQNIIAERRGHGSPGNDQRRGEIPYIKVSDIRGLRVNINPTNLIPISIAKRLWRGEQSGLNPWDVITPNRASSNIGEFAILLPGEEQLVITKEVFVFRVVDSTVWDPFYLLWALSLQSVREQWRRIALMQTNREDCGDRYKEIILPNPKSRQWALNVSKSFREYFTTIAEAKSEFISQITEDDFDYIASVISSIIPNQNEDIDSCDETEN